MAQQRICLHVMGAQTEGNHKVKAAKEQLPPGLPGIKLLHASNVDEIPMIGPNHKQMFCSLEPVVQLLQDQLKSWNFAVTDAVISLGRTKPRRERKRTSSGEI